MNKDTSIYLDCVRFLAAFAVMLCHIDDFLVKGVFPFIDHLGVESVGVFFVLSGFVIGYAVEFKEKNFRTYTINRAARLYSVVVPCLALTLIFDRLGIHYFPQIYYHRESFPLEARHILMSLTFLNHSWLLPHPFPPGNDGPFWSLNFEVPFYVMFGTACFLRGFWRWAGPALTVMLAGINVLGFFPIWLLGLWVYRLCRKIELSQAAGRALLALSVLLWVVFEVLLRHFNVVPDVNAIVHRSPILLYGSGLCFSLSVIGFRYAGISLQGIARPAGWLAGATFTLYLLHFPLVWFLHGVLAKTEFAGWPAPVRWVLLAGITFLLVLLVAQVTERRKGDWRRAIEWMFSLAGRLRPWGAKVRRPAS